MWTADRSVGDRPQRGRGWNDMTTAGGIMEGGRTFRLVDVDAMLTRSMWVGALSHRTPASRKQATAGAATECIILSQRRAREESDDAVGAASCRSHDVGDAYAPRAVGAIRQPPSVSDAPVTPARDPSPACATRSRPPQTNVPLPFSRRAARPRAKFARASRVAPRGMPTVRSKLPSFRLSRPRTTRQHRGRQPALAFADASPTRRAYAENSAHLDPRDASSGQVGFRPAVPQ